MVPRLGADKMVPVKKPAAALLSGLLLLASLGVTVRDLIAGETLPVWLYGVPIAILVVSLALALTRDGQASLQLRSLEIVTFAATVIFIALRDYAMLEAASQIDTGSMAAVWQRSQVHFLLLMAVYALVLNPWWRAALVLIPTAMVPLGLGLFINADGLIDATILMLLAAAFATSGVALAGLFYGGMVRKTEETQYELIERLGGGGMGEVWLVRHKMLARPSALKLIKRELLQGKSGDEIDRAMRQFEREAMATAALRSPHTVEIYDFGIAGDGTFYYVMEYLEGFDLDDLIREHGPLSAQRVVYLLQQVCDSLAEAHGQSFIHRDIKPSNLHVGPIGLSYDFLKVLDFGLVKPSPSSDSVELSDEGSFTGTPAFAPPEMLVGKSPVDARSDIYALGCVAYWLLTGLLVFDEETALRMAIAHASSVPEPPSVRSEVDVPEELERIVMKCLAKDPADRFQSAMELNEALAACPVGIEWDHPRAERWWRSHQPSLLNRAMV